MKITLLVALFISFNLSFSQMQIYEGFTTQELIQDVLIGNPNFPASNFVKITGTDFGDDNGIAAFYSNGVDIAFDEGIVLSTGDVTNISGPNSSILSSGSFDWVGDADLETVTSVANTYNASSIQFDFVAQVSSIGLDFLLASEEYGDFECSFPDTFAFILTNNLTGVSENIALVPETTTPISILTVRGGGNTACVAVNEDYFDRYNYDLSGTSASYILAEDSPINFNGQTEVFVLMGSLEIGTSYTVKIVIGDSLDTVYDSALFVRNSSFGAFPEIEQEPEDLVVEDTDNNGSSVFNLRTSEPQMLGSVDTSVYSFLFSYYNSLIDAEEGTNEINNPEAYTNSTEGEEIFVRMSNAYTGTAITSSFRIATDEAFLDVNESILSELKVFPNPVIDELFVSNSKSFIESIDVYNILGRTVVSEFESLNNERIKVDFSNLPNGIYLLKIDTQKGSVFKRILK